MHCPQHNIFNASFPCQCTGHQHTISHSACQCFSEPRNIDILLGCDIMFQILLRERLPVIPGQLFLHNTQFGYIVAGTAPLNSEGCSSLPSNFCKSVSEAVSTESLNRKIDGFWECEKVPEKGNYIPTELNPADCLSRGVDPHSLLNNQFHETEFKHSVESVNVLQNLPELKCEAEKTNMIHA